MQRRSRVLVQLILTCVAAIIDIEMATFAGRQSPMFYVAEIGTALVWAGVGAAAVKIRPDRRTGALMITLGLVLMVDAPAGFALGVGNAWIDASLVAARLVQPFQIPLFAHILLAYPDGRLRHARERTFLAVVYGYAAVISAIATVEIVDMARSPGWTQREPTAGIGGGGTSAVLDLGWFSLAVVYVVLLIDKVRRSTRRERRLLAYPLGAGLLLMALFLVETGLNVAGQDVRIPLAYLAVLAMPGAFLAGLIRERLSYGSVADLVRAIEGAPVGHLRDALRRALRDPGLEVFFPSGSGFVAEGGGAACLDDADGRVVLPIGGDPPIAVVLHDPSLTEEPRLLAAASAATRLALDNAQLHALVQRQLAEVRASRRRIIDAGVEQRRRLERDLHDGAQQRMLAVGIVLQLLGQRLDDRPAAAELLDEAQHELRGAVAELRELARGIHPAILAEHGLAAALRARTGRLPVPVTVTCELPGRLSPAVEAAAYFMISEALTNVVKHSGASRVHIGLMRSGNRLRINVIDDGVGGTDPRAGSGLRGIADRAAAFDGALTIAPAEPTGTRLEMELRCD